MELATVDIPRIGARERAADYTRYARTMQDPDQRAEFEELARVYRLAAREDLAVISLTSTIAAGGTLTRTRVWRRGRPDETRERHLLPRLAVCSPKARFVHTLGVERDGTIEFCDAPTKLLRAVKGRVRVEACFELPDGYEHGRPISSWDRGTWAAMVPIVPPVARPRRTSLASYLVLWEAEDWAWHETPRPPADPALLRHLAGDLYAVVSTWDLTELERLVLSGRRR